MICWIRTGVTDVINAIVIALAAIVGTVTGLMPSIPSAPDLPAPMTTALGWIAWFFPVGTLVDIMAFLAAAWLIWLGVAAIMRFAKAL
jgi:hypothetical protein